MIAPEIGVLMEVKAMGAYPLWFVEQLNQYGVRKASFSKYTQTYQRHLFKRRIFRMLSSLLSDTATLEWDGLIICISASLILGLLVAGVHMVKNVYTKILSLRWQYCRF